MSVNDNRFMDLDGRWLPNAAGSTVPADGDDYSYFPRVTTKPLIPSQWISIVEYQTLLGEVRHLIVKVDALTAQIDKLEKQARQWTGD